LDILSSTSTYISYFALSISLSSAEADLSKMSLDDFSQGFVQHGEKSLSC
jgi:hypothetical protein